MMGIGAFQQLDNMKKKELNKNDMQQAQNKARQEKSKQQDKQSQQSR